MARELTTAPPVWTMSAGRYSGLLLLAIAAVATAAAALFWPTTQSLIEHWRSVGDRTYVHGFPTAAVFGWLLWRLLPDLRRLRVVGNPGAMVGVVVLSVLWLITYRAGIQILHQALLPAIGWLAVYAALGKEVAKRSAFAFGFLYVAVPIWSLGNGILQSMTVLAVRVLLRLTGVPAYFAGDIVHVPAGVFHIAGGCSGLHFFIVAVAIAALYGELRRDTLRVRALSLLLAASLAMIGNWIRVYVIILVGHLTDMQHAFIKSGHYSFGWLVFAAMIAVFFIVAHRLPVSVDERRDESNRQEPTPELLRRLSVNLLAVLATLSIGPVWSLIVPLANASNGARPELPENPRGWAGPYVYEGRWRPAFAAADSSVQGRYERGGHSVAAYVAVYLSQRQGKELIGYDNSPLGTTSSELTDVRMTRPSSQANEWAINEWQLRDSVGRESLLWFNYAIGSRRFVSGLAAQLYYGLVSLTSAPASTVFAIHTDCTPDCGAARDAMTDLLRALDDPDRQVRDAR